MLKKQGRTPMNDARRPKMSLARSAILWVLPLFAACGGGGGGGEGAPSSAGNAPPTARTDLQIWECTIFYKTDGLTGIRFWSSCPNDNWKPRANQPVFGSLADCEAAIRIEKDTDSAVWNDSQQDRDRTWARRLVCSAPDTTPPRVLSESPADGSNGFPATGTSVRAEFSDNMNATTINVTTFILEDPAGLTLPGTVSYSTQSRTAWFSPDEPLIYLATYTARVTTGVTDKVGNPLAAEFSWSFATEGNPDVTAPMIISALPSADSICGLPDGAITVGFDEQIIATAGTFTLEDSGGALVDGAATFGNFTAKFTPSLALDHNEVYTARLGGAIADQAGNPITPLAWSFRTELAPEGNWAPIATPANLNGRTGHRAVWTGSEMIVWGGFNWDGPVFPFFQLLTDNGRYDPALDQWRSVSTIDAPRKRLQHSATWTGTEMIIWGGVLDRCASIDCLFSTNTGGRYNPATDTWTPMSTVGTAMSADGAIYDPVTDVWSALPTQDAPDPARGLMRKASVVWTGADMLVWSPSDDFIQDPETGDFTRVFLSKTRRYSSVRNQWTTVVEACDPQATPKAAWLNGRLLSWSPEYSKGQSYDERRDVWLPIRSYPGAPATGATVVIAGNSVIVWGGSTGTKTYTNMGYRLTP
ncbi:MAG: Ig-like domain-containing protein [Gammaproteobacteria bacterium]